MFGIFLTILSIIFLVLLWIAMYDSNRFIIVRHSFRDPRIRKPLRAVVLADLHNKQFGKNNEILLEAIRREAPDCILIAGDMLTSRKGCSFAPAVALLRELAGQFPIYYANGNHEHRLKLYPQEYGAMAEEYEAALGEAGVERMVNSHRFLPEYGITVYGLELDKRYFRRFRTAHMEEGYLEETLGRPGEDCYRVLLAHNPDYFPEYARWGADLVLSGHVHGGLVRIPFWKGVVSPAVRLFPKYDGGLYREDGSVMVLSRGLGLHTIPVRLFNPGELIVLELGPDTEQNENLEGRTYGDTH